MHWTYKISLSTISQWLFAPPGSEAHEPIPVRGRELVHVPPHVLAILRVLGSIVLLARANQIAVLCSKYWPIRNQYQLTWPPSPGCCRSGTRGGRSPPASTSAQSRHFSQGWLLTWPITAEYWGQLTNQRWVLGSPDQSELSIEVSWPIRAEYRGRLTNQGRVYRSRDPPPCPPASGPGPAPGACWRSPSRPPPHLQHHQVTRH